MHFHKLMKSTTDIGLSGVCGGIAEFFGISSIAVRLIFLVLVFVNPLAMLIIYCILAVSLPNNDLN
ncbi:PspC domain-containing protein [Sporolactobacillus laevolacticus]|uniref:Phage-shock protein n=1 Tax=Sporolactobacillus laevolacticus DSM 442 TaxID=1395513 RepID=V6IXN5_9BACL|nr:PspC domain-containing protein [Sporolactobacillus laevolacticus]EST12153.1 phage-shock protein [Sporolactobacillus laevolacticus DSM 442]MDN3953879.1 PspC domain-containing protein [Sporolactobacillus laevolacticus]